MCVFFFFNDTATTEIYTLSLHDALPISLCARFLPPLPRAALTTTRILPRTTREAYRPAPPAVRDRKSTRLNSSHANISYAVFCLKKKNTSSFCLTLSSFSILHSFCTQLS